MIINVTNGLKLTLYSVGVAFSTVGATQRFMNLLTKSPMVKANAMVRANSIVSTANTDNQL